MLATCPASCRFLKLSSSDGVFMSEVADKKDVLIAEWAAVRSRRNQLLRATDYTQTDDSPLSADARQAVAIYRQVLRDIPQDGLDPFSVVWPELPDVLK